MTFILKWKRQKKKRASKELEKMPYSKRQKGIK